jgi:serine/threonine-protein kinase
MQLASGDVFAGYTIVKPLGAGGMGEVYLARHPRLPRRDAVKVLPAGISQDPTFRERFIREADLASGLWHPNVVSVYDRGEHGGQLWIAMEFADGTDAGRLLAGATRAGSCIATSSRPTSCWPTTTPPRIGECCLPTSVLRVRWMR